MARPDGAKRGYALTRACIAFHLWSLAGLEQQGDRMEAAVTAVRIAANEGKGAVFVPVAMGGAGGQRAGGPPADRLTRWFNRMENACQIAIRHLDKIEAWSAWAESEMTLFVRENATSFAHRAEGVGTVVCPDGRGFEQLQPGGNSAQPRLDGSAWPDLRGNRSEAASIMARDELKAAAIVLDYLTRKVRIQPCP